MRHLSSALSAVLVVIVLNATIGAPITRSEPIAPRYFSADDVFELEWVRSPEISPDGRHVV